MKFITGRPFTRQCNQLFLHANNKLYEGMELHTKNIRFFPEHRDHQQTHKIMMDKEKHGDRKDVLVGEYKKSSAFACYHIFCTN